MYNQENDIYQKLKNQNKVFYPSSWSSKRKQTWDSITVYIRENNEFTRLSFIAVREDSLAGR